MIPYLQRGHETLRGKPRICDHVSGLLLRNLNSVTTIQIPYYLITIHPFFVTYIEFLNSNPGFIHASAHAFFRVLSLGLQRGSWSTGKLEFHFWVLSLHQHRYCMRIYTHHICIWYTYVDVYNYTYAHININRNISINMDMRKPEDNQHTRWKCSSRVDWSGRRFRTRQGQFGVKPPSVRICTTVDDRNPAWLCIPNNCTTTLGNLVFMISCRMHIIGSRAVAGLLRSTGRSGNVLRVVVLLPQRGKGSMNQIWRLSLRVPSGKQTWNVKANLFMKAVIYMKWSSSASRWVFCSPIKWAPKSRAPQTLPSQEVYDKFRTCSARPPGRGTDPDLGARYPQDRPRSSEARNAT